MFFAEIAKKFGFAQIQNNNNNYLEIETDFEIVRINELDNNKYFDGATNLIRFLDGELLDDYPCESCIEGIYFLPSHKMQLFIESLNEEKIESDLEQYYTVEMKKTFSGNNNIPLKTTTLVEHSNRANVGTSLYRVEFGEEISSKEELEIIIRAGKKILELNAMKGFVIAYGSIPENVGLLEKSYKERTKTPSSRHYNFWKYKEEKTKVNFAKIAENFEVT